MGTDRASTFPSRDTLRIMVAVAFFGLALFNWLRDMEARLNGIALTGIYTGQYDRKNVSSRTNTDAVLFYLIVEFTPPDGKPRRLALLDHTEPSDWPDAGAEMDVTWLPGDPGTLRRSDALRGVLGENALWFLGLAGVMLGAALLDRRARRSS